MKILVMGEAGFIGSNVVEYYAKKGFEPTCIDNFSRGKLLARSKCREIICLQEGILDKNSAFVI